MSGVFFNSLIAIAICNLPHLDVRWSDLMVFAIPKLFALNTSGPDNNGSARIFIVLLLCKGKVLFPIVQQFPILS